MSTIDRGTAGRSRSASAALSSAATPTSASSSAASTSASVSAASSAAASSSATSASARRPRRRRNIRARRSLTRESLLDAARERGELAAPYLATDLQRLWDLEASRSREMAARLAALAPAWCDREADGVDPDVCDVLDAQIAAALRCPITSVHHTVKEAHRAVELLPACFARLEAGDFPAEWFSRLLWRTRDLSDHLLGLVDETISTWDLGMPPDRFRRELAYLLCWVRTREPEESHVAPEERRGVTLDPVADDGVSLVHVTGPVPEVMSFAKRLDATARAVQQAQRHALASGAPIPVDPRGEVSQSQTAATLTRIRYDLLMSASFETGGTGVPADRFRINVTVPFLTLQGRSSAPGMIDGVVPIPAQQARVIAGGESFWYRVMTDPASGHFLPAPAERYTPPAPMLEHLRLQHPACSLPGCARIAAWGAEFDHIEEYDHAHPERGGATAIDNLHPLCWQHHLLKTLGLLDVVREPSAGGSPHASTWCLDDRAIVHAEDDRDMATPHVVAELEEAWRAHARVRGRGSPPQEAGGPSRPRDPDIGDAGDSSGPRGLGPADADDTDGSLGPPPF